jgi:PH (Pleckstrin Homology) domain-containing protein
MSRCIPAVCNTNESEFSPFGSGRGHGRDDTGAVELRPTPESWRVALVTAIGALAVALGAGAIAIAVGGTGAIMAAVVVVCAAFATFVPAVGALSASVEADDRGVAIHRFGRTTRFEWADVVDVRLVERGARVPDGTEYHWVVPSRSAHIVAVPCLELTGGDVRELPALAAPANSPRRVAAREHTETLGRMLAHARDGNPPRWLTQRA